MYKYAYAYYKWIERICHWVKRICYAKQMRWPDPSARWQNWADVAIAKWIEPLSDVALLRSGATIVVVVSSNMSFIGPRQDAKSGRKSRRRTPVTPSDLALRCWNENMLCCWKGLVCRCSRWRSSCLCFSVMSSFFRETDSLPLSCSG
jgi:hypothetical protein